MLCQLQQAFERRRRGTRRYRLPAKLVQRIFELYLSSPARIWSKHLRSQLVFGSGILKDDSTSISSIAPAAEGLEISIGPDMESSKLNLAGDPDPWIVECCSR